MSQATWAGFLLVVAASWVGGLRVLRLGLRSELVTLGFGGPRDPLWHALAGSARMLPYLWGGAEALRQAREPSPPGAARRAALCGIALLSVALVYAAGLVSALRDSSVPLALPFVHRTAPIRARPSAVVAVAVVPWRRAASATSSVATSASTRTPPAAETARTSSSAMAREDSG
jgi:hypothetical protein